MTLISITSALLLGCIYLLSIKNSANKQQVPICCCAHGCSCPAELGHEVTFCFKEENMSFALCQCRHCGGLMGCPAHNFESFMQNASTSEKENLLEKFYSQMRAPHD